MENKNMLLSSETILKELFNSQDFDPEKNTEVLSSSVYHFKITNKFILYFTQLLQFAFEQNLLNEDARNTIANLLLGSFSKHAEEKVRIVSNYLYITTLWLQSMSNWEAWLQLSSITSAKEASNFLTSALSWFDEKLNQLLKDLKLNQRNCLALKERSIANAFSDLEKTIRETKNLSSVNLKFLHKSQIAVPYTFLVEPEAPNYLERLEKTVQNFSIEMDILAKINAKTIIQEKRKEINQSKQKEGQKELLLQSSFNTALEKLKNQYQEKKEIAQKAQESLSEKIDTLEKEFAAKHPHLKDRALDQAFEDYLDTLPDDFFDTNAEDPVEIDRWYATMQQQLLEKLEKSQKKLQKEQDVSTEILLENDYNLDSIIREFALFSLAKNQCVPYPETLEERSLMLAQIPNNVAISEFLMETNGQFSDAELEYLEIATK